MTNRKQSYLRKTPTLQRANSLRGLVRNARRNQTYPFFFLFFFLLMFSSVSILSPLFGGVLAAIPKSDQNVQVNKYVEATFLARYPSDERTSGKGFAMHGSYMYTIIGYNNPTVIDVSDPSTPTFVTEYSDEGGGLYTLVLQGDYLYLGSHYGLKILDISNLSSITKVSEYNTTDHVQAVVVQDGYAYLAAESNGLVIVNVSDVTQPIEVSCYNASLYAWNLALEGSLAFVANGNKSGNALVILDVSDPQHPIEISHFEDEEYEDMPGTSITIDGSYAYLGTSHYGLFILNITDIYHPFKVGHFYGDAMKIGDPGNEEFVIGIFSSTYLHEQYIFEAVGANGLYVLDVSNPSHPILIGKYTEMHFLYGVYLHETYLYLQTGLEGIMILNLTYHQSTPFNYRGLTIKLITIPAIGLLIALPILLTLRKKRLQEKMM